MMFLRRRESRLGTSGAIVKAGEEVPTSAGSTTRWASRNPLDMFSYNTMAVSRNALLVTSTRLPDLEGLEALVLECHGCNSPHMFPYAKLEP